MEYLQVLKTVKNIKWNRNYKGMPIVTRLREQLSQILLIPTMLALCLQKLIVLTYCELHTPFTPLSQLGLQQTSCHIAEEEFNQTQLTSLITANQ